MALPIDIEALEEPWTVTVDWDEDELDGVFHARYDDGYTIFSFEIKVTQMVGLLSIIEKTDMG